MFLSDNRPPVLLSWFYENKSEILYLKFSESVVISNISGIEFVFATSFDVIFLRRKVQRDAVLNYSMAFGSTVQISKIDSKLQAAFTNSSLVSSIIVNSNTVCDLAAVSNCMTSVSYEDMLPEGGPGIFIKYNYNVTNGCMD
jgi:hypothetical protein